MSASISKAMQSRLSVSRQLRDENGAGGRSLFIIILCEKFSIKEKHLEVHENVGKRRDEW